MMGAKRKAHWADANDEQWVILQPSILPAKLGGRPKASAHKVAIRQRDTTFR